eukprot:1137841-Pelagomonas_calceolata.AAC.1
MAWPDAVLVFMFSKLSKLHGIVPSILPVISVMPKIIFRMKSMLFSNAPTPSTDQLGLALDSKNALQKAQKHGFQREVYLSSFLHVPSTPDLWASQVLKGRGSAEAKNQGLNLASRGQDA